MDDTKATTPAADPAAPQAKNSTRELIEIGKTIAYALLIALVIRVLLFQPFTIPSASMEPNLYQGDYIIVSKFAYGYSRYSLSLPWTPNLFGGRLFDRQAHRGDIVVFKLPRDGRTDYIKRIIGLPGDHIQLKEGVVYVNDVAMARQTLPASTGSCPFGQNAPVARYAESNGSGRTYATQKCTQNGEVDNTDVYIVPPKHYFMMGDNRDNSLDSRYPEEIGVGFVPEENLVGKADIILLAWNDQASLFKPWTWILDIRPSRWFHILK